MAEVNKCLCEREESEASFRAQTNSTQATNFFDKEEAKLAILSPKRKILEELSGEEIFEEADCFRVLIPQNINPYQEW